MNSVADYERMADELVRVVRGFVGRICDPIAEKQRDLIAKCDKLATTVESLERRCSRHADHLAALESKMQAVERKVGK